MNWRSVILANAPVSTAILERHAPMSGAESVAGPEVQAIGSDRSVRTAEKPRHDARRTAQRSTCVGILSVTARSSMATYDALHSGGAGKIYPSKSHPPSCA